MWLPYPGRPEGGKKGEVIVARKVARSAASLLNIDGQHLTRNLSPHPHLCTCVMCHTDGTLGMAYGVLSRVPEMSHVIAAGKAARRLKPLS